MNILGQGARYRGATGGRPPGWQARITVALGGAAAAVATGLIAVPAAMASGPATATPTATASAAATPTAKASAAATPTVKVSAHATLVPAHAAKGPALTISVSDGQVAVRPGQTLSYIVSLRNTGAVAAPRLEVTETSSAGLDVTSASGGGSTAAGRITWSTAVPAGASRTFRFTARVTNPPAQMMRLAAVACVTTQGSKQPIVCAAHLDRLPAATAANSSGGGSLTGVLLYAAGGLVLIAGGVAAILLGRRRGALRRRPHSHAAAKNRAATSEPTQEAPTPSLEDMNQK